MPAGAKSHEVSVSPDGKLATASNVGGDFVTLVDVAAGQALKEIKTGDGAMMSVFSPQGESLFVVSRDEDKFYKFSSSELTAGDVVAALDELVFVAGGFGGLQIVRITDIPRGEKHIAVWS